MIKILAYLIAFLLSPTVAGLAGLVVLPIVLPILLCIRKIKPLVAVVTFIIGVIVGFIAIWFASVVFGWFGLQPTIMMAVILAIGFLLNTLRRIDYMRKEIASDEAISGLGELLGIIIGTIYFS